MKKPKQPLVTQNLEGNMHYTEKLIDLDHEVQIFTDIFSYVTSDVHAKLSYIRSSIIGSNIEIERENLKKEVNTELEHNDYIKEYRQKAKEQKIPLKEQKTNEQLIKNYKNRYSKSIRGKIKRVDELLEELMPKNEVTVWINSGGGSVTDSLALIDIIDSISSMNVPVKTIGTGRVMSAAILLLASGTKGYRSATKNTLFMTHGSYLGSEGSVEELRATVDMSEQLEEIERRELCKRTNITKPLYKKLHQQHCTYFSVKEALKYGIIDFVVGEK